MNVAEGRFYLDTSATGLRTLDALHLACAAEAELELVTADKILSDAAASLKVPVRYLR
jgi:predicted nucleic acid-binding protein